jgi:signal transduction histidine kinase
MYGERDDPITVLTALGKRLEETAVPAETLPVLVKTIAQTLKLPYVAITAGDEIIAASSPPPAPKLKPLTLPLVYHSETIGHLIVSARAPGEDFNPAEINLLENVARQAGTAVYAAQLTADLQRSRERLVTTREEERRRIRRDLHDGLGPQLATLGLKVDAARNYLDHDSDTTKQLLAELKGEIQNAIGDIRRLVHDLRPPALDQLGLVPALWEFAAAQNDHNRLDINIQAPDMMPSLPAAVEVAAYRIALEAMTNAIRHSQARSCTVEFEINDKLSLKIWDDGTGLPGGNQDGVGLSSMRERTAELGGTFEIKSPQSGGTVISVHLPLG